MAGPAAIAATKSVNAQAWKSPPASASNRPIVVAQLVDLSPAQQDVSRDFLIGSRAAWQDINSRGVARPADTALDA